MTKNKPYNILLVGVGGQGLMLLTAIIGKACIEEGIKVVGGEQHGLSQRSGSIYVHLRFGDIYSPLISFGEADMILSLEATEAVRYMKYLKDDGQVILSNRVIHSTSEIKDYVNKEIESLISLDTIINKIRKKTKKVLIVDSSSLAEEAGNSRTENIVMLGAALGSGELPVSFKTVEEIVPEVVPKKTIEENKKALHLGFNLSK
ncbi:MAG: indolepyruvate oxidoreductase subunit beta [Candidatus Ranarchaeia archaeon]